jgi:hypothetical protein
MRSACPLWRAYSSIMCNTIQRKLGPRPSGNARRTRWSRPPSRSAARDNLSRRPHALLPEGDDLLGESSAAECQSQSAISVPINGSTTAMTALGRRIARRANTLRRRRGASTSRRGSSSMPPRRWPFRQASSPRRPPRHRGALKLQEPECGVDLVASNGGLGRPCSSTSLTPRVYRRACDTSGARSPDAAPPP